MKKHNKPKKSKSQLISFKFGRIDFPFERIIFATKNKAIADKGQPMANLRNVSKEDFINRRALQESNPQPPRPKRGALSIELRALNGTETTFPSQRSFLSCYVASTLSRNDATLIITYFSTTHS